MKQGLTEIESSLYVASLKDAEDHSQFSRHGVDVVVNLCGVRPDNGYPDGVEALVHGMEDGEGNSFEAFLTALQTVRDRLDAGGTVLVHCGAGLSRSPVLAAAVVSTLNERSVEENLEEIEEDRMIAPHSTVVENAERAIDDFSR